LIGWAAIKRFRARGDETYGFARRNIASERVASDEVIDIAEDRLHIADLADYQAVREAVSTMDAVVHLGADPRPDADWKQILESNITGTRNVLEACRETGVSRVVFASTIMVNWGYWEDEPYTSVREGTFAGDPADLPVITHLDPPRPMDHYAASKVWGEAMARVYSEKHGMSCLCIRVGGVNAEDKLINPAYAAIWCSQRDIVQLIERCVDAPVSLGFDIFFGMSGNPYCWVDYRRAGEIVGYVPRDGAEEME